MTRLQQTTAALFALGLALAAYHGAAGQADPPKATIVAAPTATSQTAVTTALLDQPCKLDKPIDDVNVGELFRKLSDLHGVTFRLDTSYLGLGGINPYMQKVSLPIVKGMSTRDILQEVIAALEGGGGEERRRVGIRVKGSQVILGRPFLPPTIPGAYKTAGNGNDMSPPMIPAGDIQDMLYGPTVAIAVNQKPLGDVIHQLRESSGANIAVDPRIKEKLATPVTITMNDAKLMTVLKIVGDMCDVAPAVVDNVYYLTTKENAERLTKQTELTIFGEPQVAIPAGFVSDGIRLYEKPANLKPADLNRMGNLGFGGGGGGVPTRIPESVVKPALTPPPPVEKK